MTGYDGPAHMSEESHSATTTAPVGIILGLLFIIVSGWLWNVSLLFCMKVGGGGGWGCSHSY